ncbi:MAG TPA: hypothetical protein VGU66_03755 [Candidatus Elarobacter sp.]|nr:hypothetical protein [Candidatus Elarobacter sp.]
MRLGAAMLAAAIACGGCAGTHAAPGAPHGILFVAGPWVRTNHGGLPPRDTRAYRDGRLVATYHARVLPARDRAAASLLYDELAGTARPIAGGPSSAFDPCPVSYHLSGRDIELSPDGRHGVCLGPGDDAVVVFDVPRWRSTRRTIFRMSAYGGAASWLDDRRIAVMEHRPECPRGVQKFEGFRGVAIIDLDGRVLERGPCVSTVLARPRGLIYERYHVAFDTLTSVLHAVTGNPIPRLEFSSDGGRTWRDGRPQFADADGRVFYFDAQAWEGTLWVDGLPTAFRRSSRAGWAMP